MANPQFSIPSLQELLLAARTGADQGGAAIQSAQAGVNQGQKIVQEQRVAQLKQQLEERAANLAENTLTQETRLGDERISATNAQTEVARLDVKQRKAEADAKLIEDRKFKKEEAVLNRQLKGELESEKIGDRQNRSLENNLTRIDTQFQTLARTNPEAFSEPGFFRGILTSIGFSDDSPASRKVLKNLEARRDLVLSQLDGDTRTTPPPAIDFSTLTTKEEIGAMFSSIPPAQREQFRQAAKAQLSKIEGGSK